MFDNIGKRFLGARRARYNEFKDVEQITFDKELSVSPPHESLSSNAKPTVCLILRLTSLST